MRPRDRQPTFDYQEFIGKFRRPVSHKTSPIIEFIGCEKIASFVRGELDDLLDQQLERPDNILITGPSKTGKTFVINNLAQSYATKKLHYIYLKSSWTLKRSFGDPEERLKEIFDDAIKRAPTLIFIDRLDAVCERKGSGNDVSRVSRELEDQLEDLARSTARVLVLAATNRPESIDPMLADYFDKELRFTLPDFVERRQYFTNTLSAKNISLSSEDIDRLAEATHCYSFKDIRRMCRETFKKMQRDSELNYNLFKSAISEFQPSTLKSVISPCPTIKWDDIGGVESIKRKLQVSVIRPIKHRSNYNRLGMKRIRGLLLYGPPGCSKTMLAQALATESGFNFISVGGPELMSKYVGESEAAIRKIYKHAKDVAPCIIFFDEIDTLSSDRGDDNNSPVGGRVTGQLLVALNESPEDVITIAATNRPDKIDLALLRASRLNPAIYVPLPDREDRVQIFLVHLKKLKQKDVGHLAQDMADRTNGYSGAEIEQVCQLAAELAYDDEPGCQSLNIEKRHYEKSLQEVEPTTQPAQLKVFAKFHETTISHGGRKCFGIDQTGPNSTFFSEEFHKLSVNDPIT